MERKSHSYYLFNVLGHILYVCLICVDSSRFCNTIAVLQSFIICGVVD